ncbi:biotin-dependent carboxyltransferase family protein [Pseudoalteromonas sp. T1lg10]|uniref:5-oxoprolinase subunit C family protein n=1 Tax=Pseudoalteromonas sp. T1lg10 TaxID=2077093 RepID=UPI000CF61219|nr:biotin-dependent carboxyltransferase family protein [Pseudoalteromonas sp. T1lg10]
MLTIIKPGPQLTIQDLGRFGHRHLGVSQCGALDSDALRVANLLVGNNEDAAALEITLGMAKLRFERPCCFALSGADMSANLNGKRIETGWCYRAEAGQTLTFASSSLNLRCYLAISGGFALEPVLGSCSTDCMAGFGGLDGQALKEGQQVAFATSKFEWLNWGAKLPRRQGPIHYIAEPREFGLAAKLKLAFSEATWQVSAQSNRMGLRLQAEPTSADLDESIGHNLSHALSIKSTAVAPGSIQLPPSGEPIILLNDCQTTGGYPLLGQVIAADLPRLGQLRGGHSVTFTPVTLAQARQLNQQHQNELNRLRLAMRYRRESS